MSSPMLRNFLLLMFAAIPLILHPPSFFNIFVCTETKTSPIPSSNAPQKADPPVGRAARVLTFFSPLLLGMLPLFMWWALSLTHTHSFVCLTLFLHQNLCVEHILPQNKQKLSSSSSQTLVFLFFCLFLFDFTVRKLNFLCIFLCLWDNLMFCLSAADLMVLLLMVLYEEEEEEGEE